MDTSENETLGTNSKWTSDEKPYSEHSRLYKKPTRTLGDQESRREQLLNEIKQRRDTILCVKRGLKDLFGEKEEETPKVPKQKKPFFNNKLMLSEWFSEIPDDLESDWFVKFCPKGVRNLVVAHRNITKAYNKMGEQQAKFVSLLPGGGPNFHHKVFTVLDCIYSVKRRRYYVLDVIAWGSHSLKNCDTDFRFYWLRAKFDENPELTETSPLNQYRFTNIDYFPAELPFIENNLSQPYQVDGEDTILDGVMFYYKEIHYTGNKTPFVGWLKPYMVPEMLNIPVHGSFMQLKPTKYENLPLYLTELKKKKGKRRQSKTEEMEVN